MSTFISFRKMASVGTIVLGTVSATTASAQCASAQPLRLEPSLQKQSWQDDGRFDRGLFRFASERGEETVVGFWRVVLTSKGNGGIPDGAVLDKGFAQWHADGTEIMNSSKPPVTSSFCLGVWKKVGPSRYTLNHFGISWDNYSNFAGLANIREEIVLNQDGSAFSGTFTIDQYDPNGNNPLHIKGLVTGQRIHVDTGVGDLI